MTAQELKKLLEQVTQGSWTVHCDPCHYDTASDVKSACGNLFAPVGGNAKWQEQEANARLIALAPTLARRAIAAEKLARALKNAKAELAEYEIEIRGETYNSPEINAALAEWEAAQ